MRKCPNCDAENEDGASTCFLCGQGLKKRGLLGRILGGSGGGRRDGASGPEHYPEVEDYSEDVQLEEPDWTEPASASGGQAASPKPEDAVVFKELGTEHINQGQFQRAIEANDEAIKLNPQYTDAYYNRALAYSQMGQYHPAIKDFDQAISLNSQDPDAYYNRAHALFMLHQLERAIADYDRSIQLDPSNPERYIGRGAAYFEQGAYQRAIDDFDRAIHLGDYPYAFANRAVSYIRLGKLAEAEADIKRAQELGYDPEEAIEELERHR